MTGDDIMAMRKAIKLDVRSFAELFGVTPASVYRWEQCESRDVKIEGLARQALTVLQSEIARRMDRKRAAFAEKLRTDLAVGGSMRALYGLLETAYGPREAQ